MSVRKYKDIVEKARLCQNNVKKNKKNGITSRWSYYFAKVIITPKDITKIGVSDAPDPEGTPINVEVGEADYLDICKRLVNFVEKKDNKSHKLPNWVTYKGYKIRPYLLTSVLAELVVYYADNNKRKSTVKINSKIYSTNTSSSSSSKLKPYLTNSGCSGMGQCTGWNCACNSLQQGFYRTTGILVDESTIAGWAGTTTSGTNHGGIETAVAMFNKKYNKNLKLTWYNFSDLGKNDAERWKKIQSFIDNGAMFVHLLYRNTWGHYEVIKGVGDKLTILNSLGSMCTSVSYCGYIEYRTKAEEISYMKGISQKSIAVLSA